MDSAMGVSCECGWLPAGWLLGLGRPCASPNGPWLDLLVHLGVLSVLGGRVRDAKIFPNIGMRRTSLTSELIGVGCLEIAIAGQPLPHHFRYRRLKGESNWETLVVPECVILSLGDFSIFSSFKIAVVPVPPKTTNEYYCFLDSI